MSQAPSGISNADRERTIAHLFQEATEIARSVAGGLAEAADAASKGVIRQAIGAAEPTEHQLAALQAFCQAAFALNHLRTR